MLDRVGPNKQAKAVAQQGGRVVALAAPVTTFATPAVGSARQSASIGLPSLSSSSLLYLQRTIGNRSVNQLIQTAPAPVAAAPGAGAPSAEKVKRAIAWNNRKWTGEQRARLLSSLRGEMAAPTESFTEDDIRRVTQMQERMGVTIDGMVGDQTAVIMLWQKFRLADPTASHKASDVTLVFYPGELEDLTEWQKTYRETGGEWRKPNGNAITTPRGTGLLYVKVKGNIVAGYPARGGPPIKFKDLRHTAGPTPAAVYTLAQGKPHTTSAWPTSQIAYGAELRWASDNKNVQYLAPGSKRWEYATQVPGTSVKCGLSKPFVPANLLDPGHRIPGVKWDRDLPDIYKLNDFGALAWNMQLGGKRTPYYVHTTPLDEMRRELGREDALETSHGCLHILPSHRDEMIARGYLQPGVMFVVKRYTMHLLPKEIRSDILHP